MRTTKLQDATLCRSRPLANILRQAQRGHDGYSVRLGGWELFKELGGLQLRGYGL